MPVSSRRARQRELARSQHKGRTAARRSLHALVLTVMAGGTVAFAGTVVPPTAPSAAEVPVTATAFGAADIPKVDRTEARLMASRFESRAPLQGALVELTVDGETRELTSGAGTVADLLAEAGVVVDNDDVVSLPLDARVQAGMSITVTTVTNLDEHVTETDPHETVEELDGTLPRGERRVVTEGVDGVTATTFRVTTQGGEEASREVIARAVRSERVDEVVRVGTAEPVVAAPPRASQPTPSSGPASSPDPSGSAAAPAPNAAPSSSPGSSKAIAADMVTARGWGSDQFSCLDTLWERESNWNHTAQNPSSGAYGIPQSLPGSKMAAAGSDWRTNPATQVTWGLDYISGRYGTPCAALGHSNARNWY